MQGRILRIADISEIFCHDPVKDIIDPGQHRIPASEVLMKLDFEIRAVFLRLRRISMVFFQKQFRSCQAEAVNALFYIPHHKHIVLAETLTRNCLQQLLLYQVTVLILIHQHFPVLHAQFISRVRIDVCSILPDPDQHLQCLMLQIVKVYKIFIPLLCLKPLCKLFCQV